MSKRNKEHPKQKERMHKTKDGLANKSKNKVGGGY